MLNFGASKPRIRGEPGPRGPPWIRTWINLLKSAEILSLFHSRRDKLSRPEVWVTWLTKVVQSWVPHVPGEMLKFRGGGGGSLLKEKEMY